MCVDQKKYNDQSIKQNFLKKLTVYAENEYFNFGQKAKLCVQRANACGSKQGFNEKDP